MRVTAVRKIAIGAGLIALTWLVFGSTLTHGFINFDDPAYVSQNPRIQAGLSWSNLIWAFTHIHSHNWHPLTTISHMLDCQLFGLNPAAHHFVNVLLHSVSAILLFLFLHQITGGIWSSAFVAAVFAIHPLRVESVAWISERKDVLSGLFFMLTLLAYVHYTRWPGVWRYCGMSILFVCGLLSKPMLVTLPTVLLLLDYWPLRRFESLRAPRLILEKLPLLVLSIASAVLTLIVQNEGDFGLVRIEVLPLSWRISNALAACFVYVRQMFWPMDLALAYSHPGQLAIWEIAVLAVIFVIVIVCAFALRKRSPYLLMGLSWYVLMLVPVIGLVQVGGQAHADRYTYLPQIGLLIAITWAILDLTKRWKHRGPALVPFATFVLAAFAFRAHDQIRYWRDSETLWRHALAVTEDNDLAHLNLGMVLANQKQLDDAISELEGVVARHPNDASVRLDLANALSQKKERMNDALREYEAATRLGPNPDAETELANLLLAQDRVEDALRYYRHVVQLQPSSALAHYNLAVGLHRFGQLPEAIAHYKEALIIDPNYPDAKKSLEQALLEKDQSDARFRSKEP